MFSWFRKNKQPENRAITAENYPQVFRFGDFSDTAVNVTVDTSLSLVALRSCVDLLARAVGSLSIHSYERIGDDEREKINRHPNARFVRYPNEMMTGVDWLE